MIRYTNTSQVPSLLCVVVGLLFGVKLPMDKDTVPMTYLGEDRKPPFVICHQFPLYPSRCTSYNMQHTSQPIARRYTRRCVAVGGGGRDTRCSCSPSDSFGWLALSTAGQAGVSVDSENCLQHAARAQHSLTIPTTT